MKRPGVGEKLRSAISRLKRSMFYAGHELRDVLDTYVTTRKRKRRTPWGFVLAGGSSRHHRAMQGGTFEPEETALFLGALKDTDVFLDVGANIGYYAGLARHSGKRVICLEPLAGNLDLLYATCEENRWDDVEVFPMGAGAKPGIARLYGASGTGASLLRNWAGSSRVFQRTIPLTTVDIVLSGRLKDARLFVKIDVEGAEHDVLLGAVETLRRKLRPRWLVEITLNEFHPQGMNPHYLRTFETFWDLGYIATTANSARTPVQRADVERWVRQGKSESGVINYLFSPAP
ncbi:MAG TPA: FkbM family methyltransferase [Planctomycetota bacterium]|nr:FkbM family methyltransferase [Planctomycetota bacterium]